jgi:hypothetical protein
MVAVVGVMAFFAAPAEAQRTGDHIVPSIETVCDGDPFSFGLCNAYCESHDCDSPTPIGTPRACSNILRNYKKKSGGAVPPCSCPCQFGIENDLALLEENMELENPAADIDIPGTYQQACGNDGPNGEPAFRAEAYESQGPVDGSQGIRLFYWLTPAGEETDATCNKEGGGLDGVSDDFFDWAYGPWIEVSETLTEGEFQACATVLEFFCTE